MTPVGGEKRPLEDILERLNDLSRSDRTPRTIDLREPPPVPNAQPGTRIEVPVEDADEPSTTGSIAANPPPVPNAPVIGGESDDAPEAELTEHIDLTAPTTTVVIDVEGPTKVGTVVGRGPVRSVGASYEGDSRYGRNAEVVAPPDRVVSPGSHRSASPISVGPEADEVEVDEVGLEQAGPNWFRIAIVVLLGIAVGAAVGLIVLVV